MKRRRSRRKPIVYWLLDGMLLAVLGMLVYPRLLLGAKAPPDPCQQVVKPQATVSRDQLSHLLLVPERDRKQTVQTIIHQPYCKLSTLEVRAGVKAERDAYPLAFDPKTWLVVLYEGDEYAGYAFSFRS